MIELRQLRYLLAAAEAGSFSRAARILNIKQATLSRHITHVEERLGMTLFNRMTKGAVLTADGSFYIRTVQRLMGEFDELNQWVRATRNGTAGRLAVGFHTSFTAGNLRATVTEFGRHHPEVEIRGSERDRTRLLAGVENGQLDLIVMIGEMAYPGLVTRPFWSERIIVVLPQDHALAHRDRIYWSDLAHESFLLPEQNVGPEFANIVCSRLGTMGERPSIEVQDLSRDSLLSLVALGRHISIIAETALGFHCPGTVFREIHENAGHARLGFSGYWRADNDNPVLRRFLGFVAKRYSLSPMRNSSQS